MTQRDTESLTRAATRSIGSLCRRYACVAGLLLASSISDSPKPIPVVPRPSAPADITPEGPSLEGAKFEVDSRRASMKSLGELHRAISTYRKVMWKADRAILDSLHQMQYTSEPTKKRARMMVDEAREAARPQNDVLVPNP